MKKTLAIALTGLATLALASPSFAQSFNPSSGSVSGSGSVALRQSVNVTCNVGVTLSPISANSAPIPTRSITRGSLLCAAVAPYGSWSAAPVPGSTNQIDLTIGANTVANDPCYGTVRVAYNNANSSVSFNNNVLPPVNAGGNACTLVSGTITLPGLTITP